jgi:hypothetical protein
MPVIVLVTKNIAAREIKIPPGAAADQLGDQTFFTDDLLDNQGQEVGQHSGFCTRLRVLPHAPDLYQCQATFTLPQGTITARGAFNIPSAVGQLSGRAAITGGTEAYANARGQISVTTLPGNRNRLEIDIR